MITTQIVFDHKGRGNGNEERPLEVRITIDRRSYYVNTGIKVRKSEWKAGLIVNRPNANELMKRLGIILNRVEQEVNAVLEEGRDIDVADIKRRAWVARMDNRARHWRISKQMLTLEEGTVKHYRTMLARLREFGGIRRWQDLTVEKHLQVGRLASQTDQAADGI